MIDYETLEYPDNLEVARLDQRNLPSIAGDLDTRDADALVLSSCVQMPSLASIQAAEDRVGLPVFSATTATTDDGLDRLNPSTQVPGAGYLLNGSDVSSPAKRASVTSDDRAHGGSPYTPPERIEPRNGAQSTYGRISSRRYWR